MFSLIILFFPSLETRLLKPQNMYVYKGFSAVYKLKCDILIKFLQLTAHLNVTYDQNKKEDFIL